MTMIALGEDFTNYQEMSIAPDGLYDLTIIGIKPSIKENPDVPKGWSLSIRIEGGNYFLLNHWVPNTGSQENAHWMEGAVRNLKQVVKLFNVPVENGHLDPEDFIGLTANQVPVYLAEEEYEKDGETVRIEKNKFKLPMV